MSLSIPLLLWMLTMAHVHLFRSILRLHQKLPREMRIIGDEYVKGEFRQHREASHSQLEIFTKEWTSYRDTLKSDSFGEPMDKLKSYLSEEQRLDLEYLEIEAKLIHKKLIKQ